jgi:hypothetical protein
MDRDDAEGTGRTIESGAGGARKSRRWVVLVRERGRCPAEDGRTGISTSEFIPAPDQGLLDGRSSILNKDEVRTLLDEPVCGAPHVRELVYVGVELDQPDLASTIRWDGCSDWARELRKYQGQRSHSAGGANRPDGQAQRTRREEQAVYSDAERTEQPERRNIG